MNGQPMDKLTAAARQCHGRTAYGYQCLRFARPGERFCSIHEDKS